MASGKSDSEDPVRSRRPVLELPSGLGEASLRGAVDTALRLVAFDMWNILDRALRETHGESWPETLAGSGGRTIRSEDVSTVVGALDGFAPSTRDVFRTAFGMDRWRLMDRQSCFRDVKRVRNRYAHPDGHGSDVDSVEDALWRLANAARVGELDCYDDIQRLSARVRELASGKASPPSEFEVGALSEEIENLRREAQEARRCADVAEAERERAADEKFLAEARVLEVEAQVSRLASSHEQSAAQVAELQRVLKSAQEAQAESALQLQQKELELNQQEKLQRETQSRVYSAERKVLSKDALLAEQSASMSASEDPDDLLRRHLEDLRDRLQRLLLLADDEEPAESGVVPEPGERWPFERGEDVWRLSKVHRSMVRLDDDTDLATIVGADRATELIQQFLAIRPAGGRVWVDADDDAVTYVDQELVYLGRLESPSSSHPDMRPGDPFDDFSGRSYSMTLSGEIQYRPTGESLEDVVGAKVSRAVARRIQELKPSGGRFRVNASGIVTAYVNGQWVFVTHVSPEEWFPGHLG